MEYGVSLDKLTILGDDCGRFEETINNNHFGFIEGDSVAAHPYKRNYYMQDGSLLQWTDNRSHRALRYEFNPNKITTLDKERTHRRAVVDIIRTMKYPEPSRIDIAIDIHGVDLGNYSFIDLHSRKKNYWVDGIDRLETLYIGASKSDLRVRIYDKAREQETEGEGSWWRMEAQVRGEFVKSVLERGLNPFHGIRVAKLGWKQIENIQERAMVKLLLEDPLTIGELSKHTRRKYKKILASLPTTEEINVAGIYEDNRQKIRKDIDYWLDFANRNNVI